MTASLPIEKITTYGKNIVDTIAKEKVTFCELQSLIGKLQFSTSVIMPGRPFLRRLHDLTIGIDKLFYQVRINKEVKKE